jgi:hypothetical protein
MQSVTVLHYVNKVGDYYGMIIQSVTVLHYLNTVGASPTL